MRATDQWYSYIAVSKKVHCGPVGSDLNQFGLYIVKNFAPVFGGTVLRLSGIQAYGIETQVNPGASASFTFYQ